MISKISISQSSIVSANMNANKRECPQDLTSKYLPLTSPKHKTLHATILKMRYPASHLEIRRYIPQFQICVIVHHIFEAKRVRNPSSGFDILISHIDPKNIPKGSTLALKSVGIPNDASLPASKLKIMSKSSGICGPKGSIISERS